MHRYIAYFTPTTDQLIGLGALLVVCAGLVAIGAALGKKTRPAETDLVAGWAVVSLVFTAGGGLARIGFGYLVLGLAIAAAAAVVVLVRDRRPVSGDLLRTLALLSPMLWLAACMSISQWDEFTQWMPNARYIYTHDMFPGEGRPVSFSAFPAYPHGLAYVIYLASRIAGHLAENVAGAFNVVLLACFAVMIGRVARMAVTRQESPVKAPVGPGAAPHLRLGWSYCAVGGLAVTALNPTFVPKIVFTAYADTATAVLVGMLCVLVWQLLNVLSNGDAEKDRFSPGSLAVTAGLVAMALISVKQVNLVLFILVAGAGAAVALRDPAISFVRFAKLLVPVIAFPVGIYVLWRLHIQLGGVSGEFAITPYSDWLLGEIGIIVSRMALIASKKGGYFGIMLIACVFAARALWRVRGPFDRLSLLIGLVFAGYTAFLLFAYVAAFGRGEGLRAASYWRYNMHLGGACVAFGAYGAGLLWRRWIATRLRRDLGWAAIVLLLAVPLAAAHKIRFDTRVAKIYVREVAEAFTDTLPAGARVAIFDLTGNGAFGVIARYAVSRRATIAGEMTAAARPTQERIGAFIATQKPDYIWIHVPTDAAREALGVSMADRASHLLRRGEQGWEVANSWPYPGYVNPNDLPD